MGADVLRLMLVTGLMCPGVLWAAETAPRIEAQQILKTAGVQGGLVVHVGCDDGRLVAALRANGRYLVHGLDPDPANVERARQHVRSLGLYGKVSIERWSGPTLPYADNMVNLVVVQAPGAVPTAELMRVLCPNGVACTRQGGRWTKTVKPRPKDIDEWTHALHGPDGNAVANDALVGPPRYLQWVGRPRWARSHEHLASVSVVVSSAGRLFSIVDEGPTATVALPPKWALVARDAFNGVVLWKKPIATWEPHLRGFRSGPAELQRRLVAVGQRVYVTLGYGQPVTALDAATGATVRTYEGTDGAMEIVCHNGVLYVVAGDAVDDAAAAKAKRRGVGSPPLRHRRLLAIRADTGVRVWQKADADTAETMPLTLAVAGTRVLFHNTDALLCLDVKSGLKQWRTPRTVDLNRRGWSTPTLVIHKDVVLVADHTRPAKRKPPPAGAPKRVTWTPSSAGGGLPGELVAYAADTGAELWRAPCHETYTSPADVLVADGLVWTGRLTSAGDPGITEARDPRTGAVVRRRPKDQRYFHIGMAHHRCYRNKATNRYLLLGRAGVAFIELASGKAQANHWVRGACQYGIVPCNGLLYAPSHSCACYIEAKLNGFNALAADRAPAPAGAEVRRIERGPAYGDAAPGAGPASQDDWPTYRRDPARSGCTASAVPTDLAPAWQTRLGGRLSTVVVADGKVLVASIDTHTVHALEADTGKEVWTYTAGGRVDSPPTIHNGRALFGSADGWVYCVRVSDGRLAWRFRAAPEDRRVVAYGQVESVWPVHGNVLVLDAPSPGSGPAVAYVAAGRSSFLDGGITLYGLDVRTGKKLCETRVCSRDPKTGGERRRSVRGFGMDGALPDVLSSDGSSVYMRHRRFDRHGVEQTPTVPHLFCAAGFLDGAWWHRTYWMFGTRMGNGWGGWPLTGRRVPAGRMLVCDASCAYGFGRVNQYTRSGSHVGLGRAHYRLFASDKQPRVIETELPPPRARRKTKATAARPKAKARAKRKNVAPAGAGPKAAPKPGKSPAKKQRRRRRRVVRRIELRWSQGIGLLVRAMVLSRRTLFIAGPPDLVGDRPADLATLAEQAAAMHGSRGALLWCVSADDGKTLAQRPLESPPVWDGMVAAGGRLYLATTTGTVLCLGGRR